MEIHVKDDRKIVEIWLPRDERLNPEIRERLQPIYQQFQAKQYTVAVFLSGTENLAEATGALLRHNRIRSAELEVQQEHRKYRGSVR